ncbi:MAG: hypothetical protein NC319_01830 [Butyricicoccus sp.]|nr:hypothetical protein [Butyricicoccus sp.]
MYPDQLYDLALAFRKTKLWKRLYDSELFAVSLSNGEIGYCCVMDCLGEHIALAVYIGEQGLDSYCRLQKLSYVPMNALQAQEFMLSQYCLQCLLGTKDILSPQELAAVRSYGKARGIIFRGKNTFPKFMKYMPARYPWPIHEASDVLLLCEALTAALEVSEKLAVESKYSLGFTDGPAHDRAIPLLTPGEQGLDWGTFQLPPQCPAIYPEPTLRNELLTARLKKQKKRSGIWECDVVMFPQAAFEDEDNTAAVPLFSYMLLAVDQRTELVIPTEIVSFYEEGAEELLLAIGNRMLENGVPAEIQVINNRTYALLKNLAAALGIHLVRRQGSELLDSLEENLLDYCDEQTPDTVDEAADSFKEMLLSLDDDVLLSMPGDFKKQLRSMERQGLLAEDVARRVRDLF